MSHGPYRSTLHVGFILAILAILLSSPFATWAQAEDASLFTEGYQAFQAEDNDKAIATLTDVLKRFPNGQVNDLALYWLGKAYQKAGRNQEAEASFQELVTKYPQSSMAAHAARQLTKLAKAPSKAATKTAPVAKKPEDKQPRLASGSKTPKKVTKQEARTRAIESYERIIREAPTSPEAAAARERLLQLRGGEKATAQAPLKSPASGESVFLIVERVVAVDLTDVSGKYTSTSGQTIAVPFSVTNRGNAEDAFSLATTLPSSFQSVFFHDVEGSGKVKEGEPAVTASPRLAIGQRVRFVLQARLPVEMQNGIAQAFEIKASSKSDPTVTQGVPSMLVASAPSLRGSFSLDRANAKPGDAVSYTLNLSNVGSSDARSSRVVVFYPGTLNLIAASPASTSADPQLHTVTWDLAGMVPNDRRAVRLDFRVREDAPADQDLIVRAILQAPTGEQTVSVVSPTVKVDAIAAVRVAGPEAPRTVFPRETVYIPFTLRNTGNGQDRFTLRAQSDLPGKIALVEDRNRDGVRQPDEPAVESTRMLNPQEEMALLVELTVPSDETDAMRHSILLSATSERAKSVAVEASRVVVVSRPVVAVATQMAAKEGVPGKVFSYQLVATNTGTSPAKRVLVSESLPPELEFVDAQPRPGQIEGQRLNWEIADLGSGQKEILTVGVRVRSGIPAGTAVRKTTWVRYRDLRDQVYESNPGQDPH